LKKPAGKIIVWITDNTDKGR